MQEYRNMSNRPQDTASGQMIAPGETVEFSAEQERDPFNKRLIDEGVLASTEPIKEEPESSATRTTKRSEGGEG